MLDGGATATEKPGIGATAGAKPIAVGGRECMVGEGMCCSGMVCAADGADACAAGSCTAGSCATGGTCADIRDVPTPSEVSCEAAVVLAPAATCARLGTDVCKSIPVPSSPIARELATRNAVVDKSAGSTLPDVSCVIGASSHSPVIFVSGEGEDEYDGAIGGRTLSVAIRMGDRGLSCRAVCQQIHS